MHIVFPHLVQKYCDFLSDWRGHTSHRRFLGKAASALFGDNRGTGGF